MGDADERQVADAALRLVDVDPRAAWAQASGVLARIGPDQDAPTLAIAGRAAGLAALHLEHVDMAVDLLRAAVACGRRSGETHLEGEAAMSLAYALTRRGEPRRALRTVDTALARLTGLSKTRARAQRGGILHQLGRLDDALNDYGAALPALRAAGDWAWVQRVHSNRAVLRIYRSQLDAAEGDLREAIRVCCDHKLDLQLALAYDNLGFLYLRRGDVPAALHAYDEAERRHVAAGAPAGTVLLDRSELLLSVHLVPEAREAAQRAVDEFARLRRYILLPQAQLLLADAALLDGDVGSARHAAEQALRRFRRQQRPEWVAVARHTVLKCRLQLGGRSRPTVRELAAAAEALDAGGFPAAAAEARLSAARLALEQGRLAQARTLVRQSSAARDTGPAELRVHAWHGEALLRLAEGSATAATAALRQGVRILTDYQATLGATDLRAHASWHRTELVTLGLRLAVDSGRPRTVLDWAERGRAITALTRTVRPPEDPQLAQAMAELRATVAELAETRTAGAPRDALERRQVALERAVRERVRHVPGLSGVPVTHPTITDLSAALGDSALVEYVELDGRLHALTVIGGRARLHALGGTDDVRQSLSHVPFALRRLLKPGRHQVEQAAIRLLTALGAELDDQLLRPLASYVRDRPLVLVPTGPLQCIPWALLPSCLGRPVTVAPSATLWHRAATATTVLDTMIAVAGPGLPNALVESRAIARLYSDRGRGAQLLAGSQARVDAVRAALGRSEVAHLAAHGVFRADNPLFSYLRLSDGPLTVYDLESLPRVPSLVVLAACESGQAAVLTGDELLGLAATFLMLGTRALIGTVVPVPDAETASLMVDVHRQLLSGKSVAAALAVVQERAARSPALLVAASGLVCLGAASSVGGVSVPGPLAPECPVPATPDARDLELATLFG